jgi:glycolate oxidase FAD binding subunit
MRPSSVTEASDVLIELAREGRAVRPVGGRTQLDWGPPRTAQSEIELETGALNRILEHNHGDFTAVLEAGVPLARAQAVFAEAGQMLAWDPPLGEGSAATVGGILATADSGPSRHRYGGVRDTVVGITVVLSDGNIAKAGGKVIKNVAGYDLAKLFAGSFGTLGLIAAVCVRLHPATRNTATVTAATEDPEQLAAAAIALARRPLEADCLDVAWENDAGELLVRFAGATAERQARDTAPAMGLDRVVVHADDDAIWERQRSRQRSRDGAVLKVSGRPTDLPAVVAAVQGPGDTLVSRAALGLSWIRFAAGEDLAQRIAQARAAVAPRACTQLDGARGSEGAWAAPGAGARAVMERVKQRFDPAATFRPVAFAQES